MAKKKAGTLDVLVVEHSALKRRIAIETFRANGYSKRPSRLHYSNSSTNWIMLKKGKVKIRIEWPSTVTFLKKRVARKRR